MKIGERAGIAGKGCEGRDWRFPRLGHSMEYLASRGPAGQRGSEMGPLRPVSLCVGAAGSTGAHPQNRTIEDPGALQSRQAEGRGIFYCNVPADEVTRRLPMASTLLRYWNLRSHPGWQTGARLRRCSPEFPMADRTVMVRAAAAIAEAVE